MIDIPEPELRARLEASLSVARWVDQVAAAAPFASLDALLTIARDTATPLSEAEIDEAIAHHPRIGEKAAGNGISQTLSAGEQASVDDRDAEINRAIAEGNLEYEARFGRVFLIRAAGRSRAEILSELRRRLSLDDVTERAIVGEQLREIALLRLTTLFGEETA
jgi:2-oxo-4-hydroxy-4-carboxy-5-ureidoimidazoline decarboxylase